jgi:hypothetical protein
MRLSNSGVLLAGPSVATILVERSMEGILKKAAALMRAAYRWPHITALACPQERKRGRGHELTRIEASRDLEQRRELIL